MTSVPVLQARSNTWQSIRLPLTKAGVHEGLTLQTTISRLPGASVPRFMKTHVRQSDSTEPSWHTVQTPGQPLGPV